MTNTRRSRGRYSAAVVVRPSLGHREPLGQPEEIILGGADSPP